MSANNNLLLPPEELADLHIFVVPVELWLEKYRTAFNNIALESVSAGFVRVLPYISLHALRDHIEEQLGADVVPEDYVFLRSVGRCMAVVKENQERLLKAKDFLPPVAYSPEIFVLSGTHDDVAKPVTHANTVIATHGVTTAGMASTQQARLPMIPPGYPQNPPLGTEVLSSGYFYQQSGQMNEMHANNRRENVRNPNQTRRRSYESENEPASDDSGSSGGRKRTVNGRGLSEDDGGNRSSENDGSESENKRFPGGKHVGHESNDEVETSAVHKHEYSPENSLSQTKRNIIQKKTSSDSSGSSQSGQKTVKFIQPEVYQSLAIPHPGGQFISPPTPIPSGRVIPSPLPPQQADQGPGSKAIFSAVTESKEDRIEGGLGAENNLFSDRPKNTEQKGKKKKRKGRSRSPSSDTVQAKDQNSDPKTKMNDIDNLAVHSEATTHGSDSPPSLNEVEERSKFVQFPSPMKNNYDLQHGHEMEQEFVASHLSSISMDVTEDDTNNTIQHEAGGEEIKDHKNTEELDIVENSSTVGNLQGTDGQQETSTGKEGNKLGETNRVKHEKSGKGIPVEGKTAAKKTVKKTVKKPSEDLDEKFKIPKVPTPALTKRPQKRIKELEKDTPSAKDRKHQELDELKAELRKAKNDRVNMEKERESKVRRAKMLQNQMLQKRNQAKNIWKKKFFDEKRKTAPLEEQVNRLRYEVDVQHKALMSYLESKEREVNKSQQGTEFKTPSEKTNQRMSLARLQHEVEELRSRIEELKVKLAAEMKKRDAAQKELKQIREDLMDKKINLTLTKSQKSLATLANPENITV